MPMLAVERHSRPQSWSGWPTHRQYLTRGRLYLPGFRSVLEDDHELVAAEPRHDVAGA